MKLLCAVLRFILAVCAYDEDNEKNSSARRLCMSVLVTVQLPSVFVDDDVEVLELRRITRGYLVLPYSTPLKANKRG